MTPGGTAGRRRVGVPVLALRAIGLGDALTGVPALRALRRRFAPRPLLLAAPTVLGRWLTDLDVVDGFVPTADLDAAPAGPVDWSTVGRNDPCPCGSGKKFKKCHGTNV